MAPLPGTPWISLSYAVHASLVILVVAGLIINIMSLLSFEAAIEDMRGKWIDVSRESTGHYICVFGNGVGNPCPADWEALGGNCYKGFPNKTQNPDMPDVTWSEAEASCRQVPAQLVSIESREQDSFAFQLCEKSDSEFCFLGLHVSSLNGMWRWSSDSLNRRGLYYRNWVEDRERWQRVEDIEGPNVATWITTAYSEKLKKKSHFLRVLGLYLAIALTVIGLCTAAMGVKGVSDGRPCLVYCGTNCDIIGAMVLMGAVALSGLTGVITQVIVQFITIFIFILALTLGCCQCHKMYNELNPDTQEPAVGKPVAVSKKGKPVGVMYTVG